MCQDELNRLMLPFNGAPAEVLRTAVAGEEQGRFGVDRAADQRDIGKAARHDKGAEDRVRVDVRRAPMIAEIGQWTRGNNDQHGAFIGLAILRRAFQKRQILSERERSVGGSARCAKTAVSGKDDRPGENEDERDHDERLQQRDATYAHGNQPDAPGLLSPHDSSLK